MSAPTAIHVPLEPMTLEIHPVSSSHVSWVYKWSNVDLSSKVESFSPDFGHANGWAWRLLLQHHTNPDGNRVYSLFLYVVLTDTELCEPTWTRKIRVMQFQILNSEGRRLKDKSTIALFNEHQLTWGFPGLIDNTHLLRDSVVASNKKVDIICRLRYLPEFEKIRRPLSPPVTGVYGRSFDNTTPEMTDHNAAAKVFDPRAVVVDSVGSSLRTLVNNSLFSDIQIVVGPQEQRFHGHKAILAARSVWFESALNPLYREAHEGIIRLPEEDPKIFEMLFEFLYTGDYPLAMIPTLGLLAPPTPASGSPIPKIQTIKTERRPNVSNGNSTSSTPSPTPGMHHPPNGFGYTYEDEESRDRDIDELDETRFQLYLMADKYGVSQLKCLVRVHLTNELLDPASGVQQGPRLLKLIRFAFEELPEAVTGSTHEFSSANALECPTGISTLSSVTGARLRDSGLGEDLIGDGGLADRVVSPGVPGFDRVYARGATQFSTNSPAANSAPVSNPQPDGSNAARVLSSVFAPPPPPSVVSLPIGNGNPNGNNRINGNLNRAMSNSSTNNNRNGSGAQGIQSNSSTPGPSTQTGTISGGGVGLFGNGGPSTITPTMASTMTSFMSSGSTIIPSMSPSPIPGRNELVHTRDTPSRIADRDTRRTGSGFGFRGGWQSSASNISSTTAGLGSRQGRYGRDNETALLREAIVTFVAKMFPAVRRIPGFEDMMKEGGDMGGFATEVMDRMFSHRV